MKKILFLLLLLPVLAFSRGLFISPSGSDTYGNGTIINPYLSVNKAWPLIMPGDTLFVRGGIYAWNVRQNFDSRSGTAEKPIVIKSYQSEKPIFTRSATYYSSGATIGIYFRGNYIKMSGLEITGFNQIPSLSKNNVVGLWVTNSSNCIFENLSIHDNGCGMRIADNSGHNKVVNCDFYNNFDPYTSIGAYENADGLQIAFLTGPAMADTSWITGCRFWFNSDDGFDSYSNDGVVILHNNWSFWNGYLQAFQMAGGGSGYKLGPTASAPGQIKRIISNCLAVGNRRNGFNQNQARCKFNYQNNTSYKNGWKGFAMADDPGSENLSHTFINNLSYQNGTHSATVSPGSTVEYNSFLVNGSENSKYQVNDSDFSSTDQNLLIAERVNNELPVSEFLKLVPGSDLINTGKREGDELGAFQYVPKILEFKNYYKMTVTNSKITIEL